MDGFYKDEIIRMLKALSHGAVVRLYRLAERLYHKELG